eukprot:4723796-Prymnesium_polylepis.1
MSADFMSTLDSNCFSISNLCNKEGAKQGANSSKETLRKELKSDFDVATLDDTLGAERDNLRRLIFNVIATE